MGSSYSWTGSDVFSTNITYSCPPGQAFQGENHETHLVSTCQYQSSGDSRPTWKYNADTPLPDCEGKQKYNKPDLKFPDIHHHHPARLLYWAASSAWSGSSSSSISWSFSLTRPQVVVVSGSLAAVVGLFLMVPPAGKSLSKPSSKPADPARSLRQPLLELDLEDREKDLRRLTLSRVPTGV